MKINYFTTKAGVLYCFHEFISKPENLLHLSLRDYTGYDAAMGFIRERVHRLVTDPISV